MILSKLAKNFALTFSTVLLCACAPTIHYLGDSFQPTTTIQEFFDEKTITRPYRVIGLMTNSKFVDYDVEVIRTDMVKKAKEVGADAILYSQLEIDDQHNNEQRTEVKAKLIKFD